MPSTQMEMTVVALKEQGIAFEKGLTTTELQENENRYDFRFPPDLAEFLSIGLPVSQGFPNWRTGRIKRPKDVISIAEQLKWPADGICFDIEHDNFWIKEWGPKPENLQQAFQLAREKVKEAPALIPVCQHRFLPSDPPLEGNPVLSVWQTDIIYYGLDLPRYLAKEFRFAGPQRENGNKSPRRIRFWSDLIEKADAEFEMERGDF
jgi:hypothetical protein